MADLTCSHHAELRQASFGPNDLGVLFSATVRSPTLRVLRTVFLPNAVDYFALSRPVGRLMLLCREMHSFNGLVHVCMQWLARNEQGRGTVIPLMRPLTWECDGARAQRFFLKSVQDVSEVLNSLGSFPVVMYCEKILGFCNWRPRDIDNFVFTEHQFSAVQARYRFCMRSLDLEHTYQEWAAVYNDHEDEVLELRWRIGLCPRATRLLVAFSLSLYLG